MNNTIPINQCPICLSPHEIKQISVGKGRFSKVCKECYPRYMCAYNIAAICSYRAKKYNFPIEIDIPLVLSKMVVCPRTGQPFQIKDRGKNWADRAPFSPSIDRKIPNLGYTKENCQVVAWWYNMAKQTFTDDDILSFCQMVAKNG